MLITEGLLAAFPTFDDLPLNKSNESTIRSLRMAAEGPPRNLLLHGKWGTGKTTLAELLVRWRYFSQGNTEIGPYLIDCSNGPDLDRLAAHWQPNWAPLYGVKEEWYVIDEVSRLRPKQMDQLVGITGRRYNWPRHFILTTNNLSKVDGAIQSRCPPFEIDAPTPAEYLGLAQKRLLAEGVTLDDARVLKYLLAEMTGDMRDTELKLKTIIWKCKAQQRGSIVVP